MASLTVVVAYDISSDSRRSRAAAVIQMMGDRIQESVYLCTVSSEAEAELRDRLAQIIDPHTDSVYMVRQCRSCWEHLAVLGQAHPPRPVLLWEVL